MEELKEVLNLLKTASTMSYTLTGETVSMQCRFMASTLQELSERMLFFAQQLPNTIHGVLEMSKNLVEGGEAQYVMTVKYDMTYTQAQALANAIKTELGGV